MDDSTRNHAEQEWLIHTRAHITIFATQFLYFRKLQAPRIVLVCGATCCMHVFAGFVDKFSDISGLQYAMALCIAGREIYTKYYQYIHLRLDTKLSTRHAGRQLPPDEIPDSKITHQRTAAIQVRTLDTALRSVVEDMKAIS